MQVCEIMTSEVYTCRPQDTLDAAAAIMRKVDCGSVPIVEDDGRVRGLITDRDICLAAFLSGLPLRALRIDSVLEGGAVQTCTPEDDISTAANTMRHAQIRRLPVVNENAELVGILSLNDISRASGRGGQSNGVRPEEVGKILTAISVPHAAERSDLSAPR